MKSFYVGTRIDYSEMNLLLDTSISKMNESLSKKLRSSVLKKGIKKTEQGKKLLFYNVDEEQYNQLISKGINVLVKVDSDELTTKLRDVNSRYPSRMDSSTYMNYESEMEKQFMDTVEVVGKDENFRKSTDKVTGKNPYKVGDWIRPYGWNLNDSPVRISRVSDKSIWYQYPYLKDSDGVPLRVVSNYDYVRSRFENVIGWGNNQEWDWTVPFKGNEESFFFGPVVGPRRISEYDVKHPRTITDVMKQGYRSERHETS
jgi:hypothetical protein